MTVCQRDRLNLSETGQRKWHESLRVFFKQAPDWDIQGAEALQKLLPSAVPVFCKAKAVTI